MTAHFCLSLFSSYTVIALATQCDLFCTPLIAIANMLAIPYHNGRGSMVSCIVPNLEYLAVRILVQNLLDGNVEWRLSLAEGMSVARTTTRVHLALTSHRTRCRVLTSQLHARKNFLCRAPHNPRALCACSAAHRPSPDARDIASVLFFSGNLASSSTTLFSVDEILGRKLLFMSHQPFSGIPFKSVVFRNNFLAEVLMKCNGRIHTKFLVGCLP